jgi:VanZ family protein
MGDELKPVALGIIYGFSDEWHQSFVPGREASLRDIFFDGLGVWTAAATHRPLARKLRLLNPKVSCGGKGGL